ncbi:MAG TPA: DNA polymerase/3'-5' exonuclease PolX [Bacillota bacterium]|nr:DNA polymerase/3'-5' exonuclease PolX [Bacillota bacterium]
MEPLNQRIAASFDEIADLLELAGDNQFKIRAYRRAAEAVRSLDEPAAEVLRRDQSAVPGIGEALRSKIWEMELSGRMEYLERLRAEIPAAIVVLTQIPGIGPKTARRLYESLGIEDVASLLAAARAERVREIPGFGAKTEANIIKAIQSMQSDGGRKPLYMALPLAEQIVKELLEVNEVEHVDVGGSIRRRRDTIGDIDIIAAASDSGRLMDRFASLDVFCEITSMGHARASAITWSQIRCDLWVVQPESYWTGLHHVTGSKDHHVRLRGIAGKMGLLINERGVYRDSDGQAIAIDSEEAIYSLLGMSYIIPELREDRGEIEAALRGALPAIIDRHSIRGDLHTHTSWSDGGASIDDMAKAARAIGYDYFAITDHSRSLGVAHGLSTERILRQIEEVREANARTDGIRILAGAEVDILKDGSLDFPDEILERLDVVVASIHSGFQQDRDTITGRMVAAMRSPHVDILAHPTGRLLARRPGYEVDIDTVIREAARTGTALEINSYPDRLDLRDEHARAARDAGVMISVSTDSHSPEELPNIEYGVWVARRAWLEPGNVVNAMGYDELIEWLHTHKASQS